MRIQRLRAIGWRNLGPLDLVLDPAVKVNVLYGDNGQGKTNVLEALYYAATFRSFRTSDSADLIQAGASEARIGTDIDTESLVRSVETRLVRTEAAIVRTIRLDGKGIHGVRAAFGVLGVVLFVPEDLLLVRAAPAARRRFLDMAISGVERGYFAEAAAFQKVLRSRNALLRTGRAPASPGLLDTYDEQLAIAGARVVVRRRALVGALGTSIQSIFQALHAALSVELTYESDPRVAAAISEIDVVAALLAGLLERRSTDERRGHTTFGPQQDDLGIRLDGRPAHEHASQGQLRSLVLALKLAELSNLEACRGETPVLLLDDVPSELDPTRRRYLFEALARLSCQTMISVADRTLVPRVDARADWQVVGGRLMAAPAA